MPNNSHERNGGRSFLNRAEVLKVVVAYADSTGIRDRKKVEQLTSQVIERLEQQQTPPGMENLVPKHYQQKRLVAEAEVRAAIRQMLAAEEAISLIPKEKHFSAEPVVRKRDCTRRRENAE